MKTPPVAILSAKIPLKKPVSHGEFRENYPEKTKNIGNKG
jgi:hypothetical protein